MPDFVKPIIAALASPVGVIALAALDSSVVFFLPLAVDVILVALVASQPDRFWLLPLLATVGSLAGAAGTYWVGSRLGQAGIRRLVPERRWERVSGRVEEKGAVAIALTGFLPPPFPFTALTLASGALDSSATTFLTTLAAVRLVRFGIEAVLARLYGERIVAWLESGLFHGIAIGLAVVAAGGTAWSAWKLWRGR